MQKFTIRFKFNEKLYRAEVHRLDANNNSAIEFQVDNITPFFCILPIPVTFLGDPRQQLLLYNSTPTSVDFLRAISNTIVQECEKIELKMY